MTEAEINEKAREIYTRCFDDEYEYTGVLNALVIAVRETAREMAEKYEKQKEINKELQKENAELKESLKKWKDAIYADVENYDKQFTKAIEIIREFVKWANWQGNSKCPSFKSIQDKAEQFLNSEVKK